MKFEHFFGRSFVEIAGGLVGDQDRRIGGDGAGDRHSLFLAAGELARIVMHALGQADDAQGHLGMGAPFFFRQRRQDQRQLDVFQRGSTGIKL